MLVPNAITVAACCAGLTAMRFAWEGRWEFACGAILIAAILDALDGRMARLLNASSGFGAQLDSLSDFVAFGVSPAVIMYYWSLSMLGGLGWIVALFFAVCCGLRLARFNSRLDQLPPYAYNYFQGVPAPAGAALCLLPLLLVLALPNLAVVPVWIVASWLITVGLLMVSEMPTFSFKRLKVPRPFILPFLALVALAMAGMAGRPWQTLSLLVIAYTITFPFSIFNYRRLKREAERLQQQETAAEEAAAPPGAGNTVRLRPVGKGD